jgi:two-component system sensor histidine kinase EvgS
MAQQQPDQHAGRRVLLVEDHPVIRAVMALQLEQLGYACDARSDGAGALRALESASYGLLLTDLNMTGLNGTQLVRLVRQAGLSDAWGQPIPVVVVSVDPQPWDLAPGVDDWLRKPVSQDRLADCLNHWLSERRPPGGRDGPFNSAGA